MKYIDAEKLLAKIGWLKGINIRIVCETNKEYCRGYADAIEDILHAIDSLHQEQPKPSCKSCGFYENNCPYIRGKFIPYPNKVCKDYTYSVMKERPEVDLEKELDRWRHQHFYGKRDEEYDGEYLERTSQLELARYFYELGLNAKKEE